MPVDLEVSLAELLADLRVHAKFMSKRGPWLPCWNEKKKPSVSKASEFSKEAGEIWILHAISCCLHIGN